MHVGAPRGLQPFQQQRDHPRKPQKREKHVALNGPWGGHLLATWNQEAERPLAPPYLGTRAGSVSAARHTSPQRHVSDLGATSKFCREGESANTETAVGEKRGGQ